MKIRSTSFVGLFSALALMCSCASTPETPVSADGAWTKVADGHYQSAPVEPAKRKSGNSLRGDNAVEKTYGVFVSAIQGVATVGIVAVAIVALPLAGGGGGCY